MTNPYLRPVVDPALLNRAGTDTRWTNLGFWRGTRSYVSAAEALARRVGEAAALGEGDTVLDFACGYGDSLALWVRAFGVRRVVGVEPDAVVASIAARRIHEWGLTDRVKLLVATAESLVPDRDAPGTTAVVCVDAAYHFLTRSAWLSRLSLGLERGTRLGLSDLALSRRTHHPVAIHTLTNRARVPEENLWFTDEIEPQLTDAGVALDRLVRCGAEVLGGFAWHAFRSAPRWVVRPGAGGWRALGVALAIAAARRRRQLDYVFISGHMQGRQQS